MGKLFTPEEVQDRVKQLNAFIAREMQLKEELVNLKIRGPRDAAVKARERHDEVLKEIDRLRKAEMLPVIQELWTFIKDAQKFLGRKELVPPHLKKVGNQVQKFEAKARR